jgi:hypothetical protein
MYHRSPFSRSSHISNGNRRGSGCGPSIRGGAHETSVLKFDTLVDKICEALMVLSSYTGNAHPTDGHCIYFPTMVVYQAIESYVIKDPNFAEKRFDVGFFEKLIDGIFTKLHEKYSDKFRFPGKTEGLREFVRPLYEWPDDTRHRFRDGFVNAQNRDLYTQLFVLQHWNAQTLHGTEVMEDLTIVGWMANSAAAELAKNRNISYDEARETVITDSELVGKKRTLATFDEYRKLIVNFAQRGAAYIYPSNGRAKTGMLYDVYLAIMSSGLQGPSK